MFFASLFRASSLHRCLYQMLLISGTPDHVKKNDFNVILFTKTKKSKVLKIHRFVIDFGPRFAIILEACSYTFSYFFAIDFCVDFLMHF